MKNCIIAQSGGPTAAINASLAGLLYENELHRVYDNIYGSINGIMGILSNHTLSLTDKICADKEFIRKLKVTPDMYLGSCRYKLPNPEDGKKEYDAIFDFFKEHDIEAFYYIGGNDSMDTVLKLSQYASSIDSKVRIIGIPKTIDNDLCHIDHTPGFGSAAKYIATSILEVCHDSYIYDLKSVTIVEIMGRDAGWLTAASALARNSYNTAPHLIYLPEVDFDKDKCINDVRALLEKQNNVIIAISEGIHYADGTYISATEAKADNFGHSQLSGAGKALEYILKDALSVKVRSIEINVLQRSAGHLASLTDLDESMALGQNALHLAEEGKSGVMSALIRTSNSPYETVLTHFDINGIANEVKNVPREWINEAGNDVTEDMLTYLRPLIQGEADIHYENGLPSYLDISHLIH